LIQRELQEGKQLDPMIFLFPLHHHPPLTRQEQQEEKQLETFPSRHHHHHPPMHQRYQIPELWEHPNAIFLFPLAEHQNTCRFPIGHGLSSLVRRILNRI
jgi:hypothetical protein